MLMSRHDFTRLSRSLDGASFAAMLEEYALAEQEFSELSSPDVQRPARRRPAAAAAVAAGQSPDLSTSPTPVTKTTSSHSAMH
jgi:hypothetical protein